MTPRTVYAAACLIGGTAAGIVGGCGTPPPAALAFGAIVGAAVGLALSFCQSIFHQ